MPGRTTEVGHQHRAVCRRGSRRPNPLECTLRVGETHPEGRGAAYVRQRRSALPLHGVGVERGPRHGAATTTAADEAGGLQFLIGPTDRAGGQVGGRRQVADRGGPPGAIALSRSGSRTAAGAARRAGVGSSRSTVTPAVIGPAPRRRQAGQRSRQVVSDETAGAMKGRPAGPGPGPWPRPGGRAIPLHESVRGRAAVHGRESGPHDGSQWTGDEERRDSAGPEARCPSTRERVRRSRSSDSRPPHAEPRCSSARRRPGHRTMNAPPSGRGVERTRATDPCVRPPSSGHHRSPSPTGPGERPARPAEIVGRPRTVPMARIATSRPVLATMGQSDCRAEVPRSSRGRLRGSCPAGAGRAFTDDRPDDQSMPRAAGASRRIA